MPCEKLNDPCALLYVPMPQTHCPDCAYPIEFDWLPCTNCPCEGELRAYAPLPLPPYAPLPPSPLPESDDESGNLYFFDTKGEPSAWDEYVKSVKGHFDTKCSHLKLQTKWGADIVWDSSWDKYRRAIGVLANFPHVMEEAELLYSILRDKWHTREELVVAAIDLAGTQLFARSITAIDWHLEKMEEATLIYKITTYE